MVQGLLLEILGEEIDDQLFTDPFEHVVFLTEGFESSGHVLENEENSILPPSIEIPRIRSNKLQHHLHKFRIEFIQGHSGCQTAGIPHNIVKPTNQIYIPSRSNKLLKCSYPSSPNKLVEDSNQTLRFIQYDPKHGVEGFDFVVLFVQEIPTIIHIECFCGCRREYIQFLVHGVGRLNSRRLDIQPLILVRSQPKVSAIFCVYFVSFGGVISEGYSNLERSILDC